MGSGGPAAAADENGAHADGHDTDDRHLFDVSTGERQAADVGVLTVVAVAVGTVVRRVAGVW